MRAFLALSAFVLIAVPALALSDNIDGLTRVAAADKEKLVCKRETPVGSLIATRKVCLTAAQWRVRIEDGNRETRKMMEDGTTRQMSN